MQIAELELSQIEPNPINIRDEIPDEDRQLQRLADDIGTMGVKTPIVVYPHPDRDGQFLVQDGHNRRRAALLAGLSSIPCVVVDRPRRGEREDIETMYTTGRNHRLLNVLEEARAVQQLLDLGMDETTLGKKFKQPRSQIRAKARVATGDERVRDAYGYGQLDLDEVMELQKLEDAGEVDIFESALEFRARFPNWQLSSVIEKAKVDVEKRRQREAAEDAGGKPAPDDASYSGKFEVVTEDLTPEEHAAAGHTFDVRHRGDGPETVWFEPKKKPSKGLTEAEKEAKRYTRELNSELALSFRVRRKHLVGRVQDANSGDSERDRELLFELLWPDISRIDEHLLGEITLIPFPTEKVNDCEWDDRQKWLAKVEKRISRYSWRQLTRLKAIREYYDTDKQLRRVDGFELTHWAWYLRVAWIRLLLEHFGYELTDAEMTAIKDWQDANWEEVLKDDRKRIEV